MMSDLEISAAPRGDTLCCAIFNLSVSMFGSSAVCVVALTAHHFFLLASLCLITPLLLITRCLLHIFFLCPWYSNTLERRGPCRRTSLPQRRYQHGSSCRVTPSTRPALRESRASTCTRRSPIWCVFCWRLRLVVICVFGITWRFRDCSYALRI